MIIIFVYLLYYGNQLYCIIASKNVWCNISVFKFKFVIVIQIWESQNLVRQMLLTAGQLHKFKKTLENIHKTATEEEWLVEIRKIETTKVTYLYILCMTRVFPLLALHFHFLLC